MRLNSCWSSAARSVSSSSMPPTVHLRVQLLGACAHCQGSACGGWACGSACLCANMGYAHAGDGFADAVSRAGALPFLALSLMRGGAVRKLLDETAELLGDRPWGVGILGFVPQEVRKEQLAVIEEFRRAAVYVHVSKQESFPGSIVEALVSGTPVVASDIKGSNEAVVEGKTGHLVPLGDIHLFARRCVELLKNDTLRSRTGAEAQAYARARFSSRSVARERLRVFDEVLRRTR